VRSRGETPVEGLRDEVHQKLVICIMNAAFVMKKMHTGINVNFCLNFGRTHNNVSRAEISRSTVLS